MIVSFSIILYQLLMDNQKKDSVEQEKQEIRKYIFLSLAGVILIWGSTFFLLFYHCFEKQGQFGDMFGAVNALFSGLAFAGLIITLILQRKELILQREELEQTRGEFVEQNKTMKRQRFENTFFNLLSLLQDITNNIEYECPDGADYFKAKGRDVFKKFYNVKNNFNETFGIKGYLRNHQVNDLLQYSDIDVFNHYFNSIDGIIKYVDTSELLEKQERYPYIVMLRNMLSDSELYILFYYYASCGGWHKDIAEQYALFYNVVPKHLSRLNHYGLFGEGAYDHVVFPSHSVKTHND